MKPIFVIFGALYVEAATCYVDYHMTGIISPRRIFTHPCADANFRGADLSNATVESVDFEGADLTGAVLTGAQVMHWFLGGLTMALHSWGLVNREGRKRPVEANNNYNSCIIRDSTATCVQNHTDIALMGRGRYSTLCSTFHPHVNSIIPAILPGRPSSLSDIMQAPVMLKLHKIWPCHSIHLMQSFHVTLPLFSAKNDKH